METPLPWMQEYPTVAAVASASFETLCVWNKHLRAPATDVERTVRRRITARMDAEWRDELAKQAPGLASQLKVLDEAFAKLFGKVPR